MMRCLPASMHSEARESLTLDAEQARVLERYHINFRRSGAGLEAAKKQRLSEITERLATIGTAFSQNVLADEQSWTLELSDDDLVGLPDFMRQAALEAAQSAPRRQAPDHPVAVERRAVPAGVGAARPAREGLPRLDRTRRQQQRNRQQGADRETVALRAERARLLGYGNFAEYRLDDAMAKTPAAVRGLLERVWKPAVKRATRRSRRHAGPDAGRRHQREVRGVDGAITPKSCARHISISTRRNSSHTSRSTTSSRRRSPARRSCSDHGHAAHDVPVWHPDVRVWDIHSRDGRLLGTFFGDYFARASKRSGAWMTTLRDQRKIDETGKPSDIPSAGAKCDEFLQGAGRRADAAVVRRCTHAVPRVRPCATRAAVGRDLPLLSGTRVATDFVELPSQLYEHWLERPKSCAPTPSITRPANRCRKR